MSEHYFRTHWLQPAVCGCLVLAALSGQAGNFATNGGEYTIAGAVLGDQVRPQIGLSTTGGFIVWEDNYTDGEGKGVSARRLDPTLSGVLSSFRVNQSGTLDQEHPQVSLLNNGGAAFVWQGGRQGFQHIYARMLSGSNTWVTGDILVNGSTNGLQINPQVATLANGNVIVVWCSMNQVAANSLQDVYGQILSPTGAKIGSEFLVNQFTAFNQRAAALAPLSGGGFVVTWVSEQQRSSTEPNPNMLYPSGYVVGPTVDIFARIYTAAGGSLGNEFLVNTSSNICANPALAGALDGGFAVAWSELDSLSRSNSWDIYARPFSAGGSGGVLRRVNTITYGEQFAPRVGASGTDYLVVYNSLGHDGSREGVFGQFLRGDGSFLGEEKRINTTTPSQQIYPTVAADSAGRFLVAWSSYTGSPNNFDLMAQRYEDTQQALAAPGAPFVQVLSSNTLNVTWPAQDGLSVAHYEVYADGSAMPTAQVTNTFWRMTGLAPASTHSVRLSYVLADGRRSPLSEPSLNTTYSATQLGAGFPRSG